MTKMSEIKYKRNAFIFDKEASKSAFRRRWYAGILGHGQVVALGAAFSLGLHKGTVVVTLPLIEFYTGYGHNATPIDKTI